MMLAFVACGEGDAERFRFEGTAGQPTDTVIDAWTPFIEVTIDSTDPRHFLVDTGAPLTHLDDQVYEIDDITAGQIDAFGLRFFDRPMAPIALFGDVSLCSGISLGGLLGGDVLHRFQFAGDYLAQKLYLFDGLDGDVPSGASLEPEQVLDISVLGGGLVCFAPEGPNCEGATVIEIAPNRLVVPVEVEGVASHFLLDTGASFVSVSPVFLGELGAKSRPFLGDVTVQAQAGKFEAQVTRLASISGSGGAAEVSSVPALVLEDEDLLVGLTNETGVTIRGLLGGSYLREFLFVIDYPEENVRLRRYAEPDHIDRREFIGPGFDLILCEDFFRIAEIYEDTAVGEKHDLVLGDAVVAINGELLAGKSIDQVETLVRSVEPGTVMEFSINRQGDRQDSVEKLEILDLLPDFR